ncbi:MAG TPA: hypothetical protein VJB67_03185 [Patescibacteria group bacterium]|nr:hypothetical protein [Patescibacteria group bacterium]
MKQKNGKLIVIDGGDASGKATQTKKLIEGIRKLITLVKWIDFPQYDHNFYGQIIRAYLAGQFGDPKEIDPKLAGILYCMDRFESARLVRRWLDSGNTVVTDRYHTANIIHQGAKAAFASGKTFDAKKLMALMIFLNRIEFEILNVPEPNLVIYLHVFPEVSQRLMNEEKRQRDGHETLEFAQKSEQVALWACDHLNWTKIECCPDRHSILTPEEIHDMIWHQIVKIL